MEAACKNIRSRLKEQYTRSRLDNYLIRRLKSLRFSVIRIQELALAPGWIKYLEEPFENIIKCFPNPDIAQITHYIKEAELAVISFMTTNLKLPPHLYNYCLQRSVESTDESLEMVFPRFLKEYILVKLGMNSDQMNFLLVIDELRDLFSALNVPFNYFVKLVAKKHLVDNEMRENELENSKIPEQAISITLIKLELFFRLFFGCSKDYKFYIKIAKIYSEIICPYNLEYCMKPNNSFLNLSITPTALRLNYDGNKQTFRPGIRINFTTLGVPGQENYRADGLIICGKHPDSDILFPPDEQEIDYASFILFFKQDVLYGIDCSSKKLYSAIKIKSNENIPVKNGMMLNLAKTLVIHIGKKQHDLRDIEYTGIVSNTLEYGDEENDVNARLIISCLDRPFAGNNFVLDTRVINSDEQKFKFMLGAGTGGQAPDIYIPNTYGISKNHISFGFKDNSWYMNDNLSTNGSYLLLKSLQEYEMHLHSKPIELFSKFSGDYQATLLLNNYVFSISKEYSS